MYGKRTGLKDSNNTCVYEFDRVVNIFTSKKATVIFREFPNFQGVVPWALGDDASLVKLEEFQPFEVIPNEKADQEFVKKFDYRRKTEAEK